MQNSPDEKFHYPGQPRDEITQRVVYKHVIFILPFVFAISVLGILSIVGVYFLGTNTTQVTKFIPEAIINLIGFLSLIVLAFLFLAVIWIWRRNQIIVTDQHIVDIDQIGLFNRKVSTLRLEDIQDISAQVIGPMQTIFQYGSIIVQTAGERENFVFDYVPHPYELEQYILETRKRYYEA